MCKLMRGSLPALVLLWTLIVAAPSTGGAEALTLHVAPNGNDHWSGRTAEPKEGDGPLLTLQQARDKIREMKKAGGLPTGGVVVEIRGGVYPLAAPLVLTAEDSGTADSPIVYRSRPGEEVRIVGGVQVRNFQPVADAAVLKRLDPSARGKVVQADLRALGVNDFGVAVGDNRPELFFQDRPMTLARWPNEGFVEVGDLLGGKPTKLHGIPGDAIGRFTYQGDRPNRWLGEKDIWLHGYWFWDWAEQRQRVESIDAAKRVIALAPPLHHYGYRKGQWYYAFNLLPELDAPGEWYLDRPTGILYFWPPAPLDRGKAVVSVIPALVKMEKASHVALRGLILEACRRTAVEADDVDNVRISGCTIRNTGSWAVSLTGKNSRVEGCDISETGSGGILLTGGDRKMLTPADLAADNNHIHHYSRWNRVYQPGIALNGVGNRATHNLIDNAPHEAVSFSGNDHRIEFNEIHNVCYESNDAGAIYSGRNWTWRGTAIRHNYFHDISGFKNRGCMGVYLDDQLSGIEISGNLFYKVTRAAMIGGGRDCTIANNLFIDCAPAIHVDARGLGWSADGIATLKAGLAEVPYRESLWAGRYPKLATILQENPMAPAGNVIARNVCVGGRWADFLDNCQPMVALQNNLPDQNPESLVREQGKFRLKDDSPAYKQGFQRIPVEKIGLYPSAERASWPVE